MKCLSSKGSALLAAALLGLAACGGDSTGPKNSNVDGSWALSLTNVSGAGVSCNSSGTTITLNQTGTTFSGSYSGGTTTCTANGISQSVSVGSGAVINGTVNGNQVSFDLDTPDFALSGADAGTSMSGTCTLRIDLGAPTGVVTLSGNWGAAKQP